MNNKTLLAIVVVIILVVLGVFLFMQGDETDQDQTTGDDTTQTENEEAEDETDSDSYDSSDDEVADDDDQDQVEAPTVRYTADGFEPSTVTVSQGETVTFVNESGNDMWVASAQHPSHEVYQGTTRNVHCADGAGPDAFDQCTSGDSYSFTFDKTGEWGYHNHVRAAHVGTVVVTE